MTLTEGIELFLIWFTGGLLVGLCIPYHLTMATGETRIVWGALHGMYLMWKWRQP